MNNLIRDTGVIPKDIHGNVTVSSIKKLMHVLKKGELLGIFPESHDYMVKNDFNGPMVSGLTPKNWNKKFRGSGDLTYDS